MHGVALDRAGHAPGTAAAAAESDPAMVTISMPLLRRNVFVVVLRS